MKSFISYCQEAYLSKQQYARRNENASKRNMDNMEIAIQNGMTEEQAEAIAELCRLRHEFHSNMDKCVINDEYHYCKNLYDFNYTLHKVKLPQIKFKRSYDYIDTIDTLYEGNMEEAYDEDGYEYLPKDYTNEQYNEWYQTNYEIIYKDLEQVNKDVEKYLKEIDRKYKTKFEPIGALRNF